MCEKFLHRVKITYAFLRHFFATFWAGRNWARSDTGGTERLVLPIKEERMQKKEKRKKADQDKRRTRKCPLKKKMHS